MSDERTPPPIQDDPDAPLKRELGAHNAGNRKWYAAPLNAFAADRRREPDEPAGKKDSPIILVTVLGATGEDAREQKWRTLRESLEAIGLKYSPHNGFIDVRESSDPGETVEAVAIIGQKSIQHMAGLIAGAPLIDPVNYRDAFIDPSTIPTEWARYNLQLREWDGKQLSAFGDDIPPPEGPTAGDYKIATDMNAGSPGGRQKEESIITVSFEVLGVRNDRDNGYTPVRHYSINTWERNPATPESKMTDNDYTEESPSSGVHTQRIHEDTTAIVVAGEPAILRMAELHAHVPLSEKLEKQLGRAAILRVRSPLISENNPSRRGGGGRGA